MKKISFILMLICVFLGCTPDKENDFNQVESSTQREAELTKKMDHFYVSATELLYKGDDFERITLSHVIHEGAIEIIVDGYVNNEEDASVLFYVLQSFILNSNISQEKVNIRWEVKLGGSDKRCALIPSYSRDGI